jgi:hypothetical protein
MIPTSTSFTSDAVITVHVPLRIVTRGGRKGMQVPDRDARQPPTDRALVKALARAFRWKRMLD